MSFHLWGEVESVEDLLDDEYVTIKKREGKERIEYIDLSCGFDTEASSFYIGEEKQACLYAFMIGINGRVYLGRDWEDFERCINLIKKHYGLNHNKRLVIYVHNLGYDFQWIRRHLQWSTIFAREKRKPIKALCTDGIEFRCSYFLTGLSLEKSCEQLTKYKVEKMVGDLDYDKIRTPKTPLTAKERGYCIHDVLGVMAIVQEEMERYGDITKIPMTNTGKVRLYCREHCMPDTVSGRKYRKFIKSLKIKDKEEYDVLKRAFTGGFTHANYRNVDKLHADVQSLDFTSSYPTVMIAEEFPMSAGLRRTNLTVQEIKEGSRLSVFNVKFVGIREKDGIPDHYISYGKCYNAKKPKLDNGRIISADEIVMTITNVDLDIIDKCYDYDEIIIGLGYTYAKAYLPTALVKCIFEFYEKKTTLKDVEGEEAIYQLFKGNLNSTYGMTVTDIINAVITFVNGEWGEDEEDAEDQLDRYNNSRNRFLFYPWGVFITAYARKNLWGGILESGQDFIYADTDSVKILNFENHKEYFENYNKEIIEKLEAACDYHGISKDKISPVTIKGKKKPLGVWDDDGHYNHFKTLGAKRYLVEQDGHYKCTIAGVNKKMTSEYISEKEDPFGFFTDKMSVDAEHSGRLISTYLDTPYEGTVADYHGVCYNYKEQSGIHFEKSDYNLTMTAEFLSLILGCDYSEEGVN